MRVLREQSMLLSSTATYRARWMSGIASGMSIAVALAVRFGMNEGDWRLLVPVLAAGAATVRPTRDVVAVALVATAAIVVTGLDDSGVLFASSLAALMLALNHLQSAATQIRRRKKLVAEGATP